MKRYGIRIAGICMLIFIVYTTPVYAITGLYFESSPTSWVGRGDTQLVTPADNFSFEANRNADNGVSFDIRNLSPNPPSNYKYWDLDLAAPFDATLVPGLYTNAARFPFQDPDQPGLTFSGNHRCNNRNAGFFEVLEAIYQSDGTVEQFAVDFTQYGEENPSNWIHGQVRYNSSFALIPEPATAVTMLLSMFGLALVRRNKS